MRAARRRPTGQTDEAIDANVSVGIPTVYRTKRGSVPGNLEAALADAPRPGAARKLSGKPQALRMATACSKPPACRRRWTLKLLADQMVQLTDHTALSRETVRRCLAENALKPWRCDMWCIPEVDGTYVARMEDVRRGLWSHAPQVKHGNATGAAPPRAGFETPDEPVALKPTCQEFETPVHLYPAVGANRAVISTPLGNIGTHLKIGNWLRCQAPPTPGENRVRGALIKPVEGTHDTHGRWPACHGRRLHAHAMRRIERR